MELTSTKTHIDETELAQRIHNLSIDIPCSVRLPNDSISRFGEGDPCFVLTINELS